jgi:hypothetical protein
MNISQMYIIVAIVILAVIALLVFVVGKKARGRQLTPVASLAFAFVLGGILFGENGVVGYGLIAAGVVLAVVDMINKSKGK